MQPDEYKTIEREVRAETKVQGSRFIATARPVTTKEEAEEFVREIRRINFDATHNCYAYRIDTLVSRSSDDGEPSGTAGKPILAAIDRHGVVGVAVVVTRYFGGTKLGTGGLARAYGSAADAVLSSAKPHIVFLRRALSLTFPHAHIGTVMHILTRMEAKIEDTTYDEDVHLRIAARLSRLDELTRMLMEQTKGNVQIQR